MKVRRLVTQDFDRAFASVDVLLTPVTLGTAPTFSSFSASDNRTNTSTLDYCTQPANLAGVPAATLPVRVSPLSGLPIALQLIAPRMADERLLSVCEWLEAELDCPKMKMKD
jgi:aspartyl-tRNA(Asn)/glutamyl-tRNA(Gln) amidotransferase subunit A